MLQAGKRKSKAAEVKDHDQLLAEEVRKRVAAEEEIASLRAQLVERHQALALANIALDDERKALITARMEAEEAKTTAMQAREATSKLAALEVREKRLQQELSEALQEVARERTEVRKRAEQQKASAESDMKRLLGEQRGGFDEQLAQVSKEADERIHMAEERFQRALQQQADEHARLLEEMRKLRAASPTPASPPPPPQPLRSTHPVWGRGPDLNTADRAQKWEAYQRERQARPPHAAWAAANVSADAFRAARRTSMMSFQNTVKQASAANLLKAADDAVTGAPTSARAVAFREAVMKGSSSASVLPTAAPFVTEVPEAHHRRPPSP